MARDSNTGLPAIPGYRWKGTLIMFQMTRSFAVRGVVVGSALLMTVGLTGLVAVPAATAQGRIHAARATDLRGATSSPTAPDVNDVIQIETSPQYDGKSVTVSSPQLQASCASLSFETLQRGSPTKPRVSANTISVILDADGNVTLVVNGVDCVPGRYQIDATLGSTSVKGFTILVINPPQITYPDGVSGYPANEVETGTTPASGNSDVYTVFNVETSPRFAEKTIEITSPQLEDRCGQGSRWESNAPESPFIGKNTALAIVDNDGNAVIVFKGASCFAGASTVHVRTPNGQAYTTSYVIEPPAVTYTGNQKQLLVTASPDPLILVGG